MGKAKASFRVKKGDPLENGVYISKTLLTSLPASKRVIGLHGALAAF